jgi:hypothetical protein
MNLRALTSLFACVAALASGPVATQTRQPVTLLLSQDHMVDHPAGAHTVTWNGPAFLDVGLPTGSFARFSVASLTPQWSLLLDSRGAALPVAVRRDGSGVTVLWLPYDGPPPPRGNLNDAEYLKALQNISASRYQGLMSTARSMGGSR